MKKFSILIVLILFLYNCQKDVEQEVINKVELKPKPYLKVQGYGQAILGDTIDKTISLLVLTNQEDWQFQAEINDKLPENEKWLSLTKLGDTLHIEAKDNYTDFERKENITISVSNKMLSHKETIVQNSYDSPLESFIPDVFFRKKVSNSNAFTQLKIESRREAVNNVQRLYFNNSEDDNYISSLAGIEILRNLVLVEINGTKFKTIDKLPNFSKVKLKIGSNHLEHINLRSLDSLTYLSIAGIQLKELDLRDLISIKYLDIENTMCENLDFKNATNLNELSIQDNNFNNLDVSNNLELVSFTVREKNLDKLDVSKNINLSKLEFGGKALLGGTRYEYIYFPSTIKTVDLSNNTKLETLIFNYTSVNSLDLRNNPNIKELNCYKNKINTLDLSNNRKLIRLNCSNNNLKVLDVSNSPDLLYLDCTNNPIEIIYVNKEFNIEKPLLSYIIPPGAVYKVKQ